MQNKTIQPIPAAASRILFLIGCGRRKSAHHLLFAFLGTAKIWQHGIGDVLNPDQAVIEPIISHRPWIQQSDETQAKESQSRQPPGNRSAFEQQSDEKNWQNKDRCWNGQGRQSQKSTAHESTQVHARQQKQGGYRSGKQKGKKHRGIQQTAEQDKVGIEGGQCQCPQGCLTAKDSPGHGGYQQTERG